MDIPDSVAVHHLAWSNSLRLVLFLLHLLLLLMHRQEIVVIIALTCPLNLSQEVSAGRDLLVLLLLGRRLDVSEIEWAAKVQGEGVVEKSVVEVAVTNNGFLTLSVVAEEDRIEEPAILGREPIDTVDVGRRYPVGWVLSCDASLLGVLILVRIVVLFLIAWRRVMRRLWRGTAG